MMNEKDINTMAASRRGTDFSFLRNMFKCQITFNRNVMNPMEDIPLDGKRMEREQFMGIGIDASKLFTIEECLRDIEETYFHSIASANREAWPIMLRRSAIEISRYYELARFCTIMHEEIYNRQALQICAMALSMVCDLIEDFCPEEKNELFTMMPKHFLNVSEPDKPIWCEYEKILERKPSFPRFRRLIIEKHFTDGSGKWVFLSDQESKPSESFYYGSLCYFAKMMMKHFEIIGSMNDNVFQWEKCISIFPDFKGKGAAFLSNKLDGFRNRTPKKQQRYKDDIDSLFKTMSREMEVQKSFSIF